MTERKPPPMYAVWNETYNTIASLPTPSRASANDDLSETAVLFPDCSYRLITLVEQPEPPK